MLWNIPLLGAGLFTLTAGMAVVQTSIVTKTSLSKTSPSLPTRPPSLDEKQPEKRAPSTSFTYSAYSGIGTVKDGWPDTTDWLEWDSLVAANQILLTGPCFGGAPPNSPDEVKVLLKAIQDTAKKGNIDPRFVLAVAMQESTGCVRIPTTNGGVRNPGILQDHNGAGTCNIAGNYLDPCPDAEINQMVEDGVLGTPYGDGLTQCLYEAGTNDVSKYYRAARIYNSGSLDVSGNLGVTSATACYASDIANRLLGWNNWNSNCKADSIGKMTGNGQGASTTFSSLYATNKYPDTTPSVAPSLTGIVWPTTVLVAGGAGVPPVAPVPTGAPMVNIPSGTTATGDAGSGPNTAAPGGAGAGQDTAGTSPISSAQDAGGTSPTFDPGSGLLYMDSPAPTDTSPQPQSGLQSQSLDSPSTLSTVFGNNLVNHNIKANTATGPRPTCKVSAAVFDGAIASCTAFYPIGLDDTIETITRLTGVTCADMIPLNVGIEKKNAPGKCMLWVGYQYCIRG